MKQRTMKRLGLFLCSCVMALSTVFAAVGLNAGKTAAVADTTTLTPQGTKVGTLGEDGLYSTSMTQIAPVKGVASNVDNVYFEGFDGSTFFLTEFTGKNAPNFAVRATNVYDDWNGEAAATAGLIFSASSEGSTNPYEAHTISVSNGFNTSSRHSATKWEPYQTIEMGKGPGLDYLSDDQTYVMILGTYGNSNGNVACSAEYYLFTLSDGVLELVNHSSGSFWVAAAAGDKAVIYPSIGAETKEISFKYSAPATSVGALVESLSVSYKQQLEEEIGGGLTLASLDRVEVTTPRDFTATNVEYIELDMASSELGSTTWILTDFVGANAPNMAFGATGGLSTWTNGHTNDANGTGMLWAQTFYHLDSRYHDTRLFTGTIWSAIATGTYSFTTLQNQIEYQRYIQIIGATIAMGRDTLVIKTYKVSGTGELSLYSEETLSGSATNYNNGKLVLYGNMYDKACGGSCSHTLYNPSGVSFRYSQPAATVEELIQGLDKKYEYRTQLAEELGVMGNSVTIKNEAGEEVSSEIMVTDYTLPESETTGFIGYEYNGELYHAGNVLTVDSDIVVTEVTLDFTMTDGASIRAKESEGYYGGMRFETTVSSAKMEKWADNIALYGMVIATENIVGGTFDVDEANSETILLENSIEGTNKDTYYITLTDVKYYNYNLEFSARAYAVITYKDGTTANFLTDYSEENNSRSVYEVAQLALDDTEYGYSTEQIDFIEDYVNYTVDLTADENGDLTLLDANTTTYEVVKNNDDTYTITVKAVPDHIASAGYIPVTVWELDGVDLVPARYVVQANLIAGNLVCENFSQR